MVLLPPDPAMEKLSGAMATSPSRAMAAAKAQRQLGGAQQRGDATDSTTALPLPTATVPSDLMQEAKVKRFAAEKCNSSSWYNGAITKHSLCAGHEEGGTDSCQVIHFGPTRLVPSCTGMPGSPAHQGKVGGDL